MHGPMNVKFADYLSTRLYEVIFHRIILLILTAVGISDLTHTVVSTWQVGLDYVTREMKDGTFLGNLTTLFHFNKLHSIELDTYMNCER